jgi:hypothetical protein
MTASTLTRRLNTRRAQARTLVIPVTPADGGHVRLIDCLANGGAILSVPEDRDGQVLEGRAGPLPRVLQQIAGVDLALGDAVADLGPRQLHDDVGRAGRECPEVHRFSGADRLGRPARGAPGDADAAIGGGQRGHVMHTFDSWSTGQDAMDPSQDNSRSMPCIWLRWPAWAADQMMPMRAYGIPTIRAVPIHSAIVIW